VDIVLLVGRILFVLLFVLSAVGHFAQTDYMAGYAKSKGLPFAKLNVLASGVVFGLAGLAIAFGGSRRGRCPPASGSRACRRRRSRRLRPRRRAPG
jgi:uncharacterized membrane protein YphA (DoxX/SURF4 family)